MLQTIGYEKASLDDFVSTLLEAKVTTLIDVRERAQSRRRGFSKTALKEALSSNGIDYLHLRVLGDPKAGREAARRGDFRKFRQIYSKVISTEAAQDAIESIRNLAKSDHACLMCYERDFTSCHRSIVANAVAGDTGLPVKHLLVGYSDGAKRRRVLHSDKGSATQIEHIL